MSSNARPEVDRRATLAALGRRVWNSVVRNKGLVAAVVATAAAEAFFTKAPFALAKPVGDAVQAILGDAPRGGAPGGQIGDTVGGYLLGLVDAFSHWVCEVLGVGFDGHGAAEKEVIIGCAILVGLAGLIGSLFIYLALVTSRVFATKVVVDLRNEVAAHLLQLPLRFFGQRRMGELISNLTNNTQVLARSFTLVADHALVDPLMILFNFGIIAVFAPEALWILIPVVPLMALPLIRLGRKVHRRSGRSLAAMGDATESMNQMLSGIKTVKTFQLEARQLEEFERNNESYLRQTRHMLQAKGRSQAMLFIAYQVVFAVLLIVWVLGASDQSIGTLAVVLIPLLTMYTHVKRIARAYNTLMESLGALDSIERILDERPDLSGERRGGIELESVRGRVAMEGVRFAYGTDEVIHGIDFDVEAGTNVALVGPSGAGKSTLVDLLVRLHDPTAGRIVIDGHDLRELDVDSYRRHTAVVGQQPFLFNTSIRDNIACGRPGAAESDIISAARAAQIHDFIEMLPNGYDTIVGERGSNLSGGQMQRIAIARALLRDPRILLLDEATSALDSESEDAVQHALTNLMKGRTSFVIAHRLSTIREADLILVIDDGVVVERGTHAELQANAGLYRRLTELQGALT